MATAVTLQSVDVPMAQEQHLFTCLSCSIAFHNADDQRNHYRSDHHRYNMKRRVASLPPVSAAVFNQKVLERRAETAVTASPKATSCATCNKSYTTENAYRSHINSKKHKDAEAKASQSSKNQASEDTNPKVEAKHTKPLIKPAQTSVSTSNKTEEQTIDEKIAAARTHLTIEDCLFCQTRSDSLENNLTHMSQSHNFFIPDADYLVDLPGLVRYLGEKIAVGNVCIYCYGRKSGIPRQTKEKDPENEDVGRTFRSLEATRSHMIDKVHCKIAYETQQEKLELSDFYDFSSSYPDAGRRRKGKSKAKKQNKGSDDEWEEADEEMEVDEVVDEEMENDESSEEDELPDNELRYGDSPYELVLPSGARIGHRSLKRYYDQNFRSPLAAPKDKEDPKSGAAFVRQLLNEKNSALVPRKGGFGEFGGGYEIIKARNAGEAKEAGRHVREFRDVQRREQFKTKVGFNNNNQKHFREPFLQ